MPHHLLGRLTAASAVLLLVSACSTRSDSESDASDADPGDVRTGVGVTDDTITIGAMTDLTAVFGPLARTVVNGNQLYFDQRNADGGICGRQVKLEVRDHAYNVQTAVSQFAELEPEVLGFVQMLGSPIVAALAPQIESKLALTFPTTWSTELLDREGQVMIGTSYPTDLINGIDFLLEEGLVPEDATLGHVYFEGEYGSDALKGAEFAAEELGLTIKPVVADPTATDLTAQVNELASSGVDAIMVSAGPRQTASVAGVAAADGLDVPILVNGPAFDPGLLETPVASALEANLIVSTSVAPFGESERGAEIAEKYTTTMPDETPSNMANYGYAVAQVFGQAMDTACEKGDLTREGVIAALRTLSGVETGVMPSIDLTNPSAMSSTSSYALRVDRSVPGGLVVAREATTSDVAAAFNE